VDVITCAIFRDCRLRGVGSGYCGERGHSHTHGGHTRYVYYVIPEAGVTASREPADSSSK